MSKRDQAKSWVNGYATVGAGIVIAAVIPGATSLSLMALEGTMAYHIGKIYNDSFTLEDGFDIAKKVGLASVAGKIVTLEALNFVPLAGWAVKAPIAVTIIKLLGDSIILYFENKK